MALTALAKLSDRLEGCDARIAALLRPYETSTGLQAQQRACEYQEMLGDAFAALRETVLERMPPLSIDNAKARRAEAEAEAEAESDAESGSDVEDDAEDGVEDAPARKTAKSSEPADIMDDLLGLDYAAAGPVLPASGQPAGKSDDPFAGVMDMLNTIETPKETRDVAMDVASLFAPVPAGTTGTAVPETTDPMSSMSSMDPTGAMGAMDAMNAMDPVGSSSPAGGESSETPMEDRSMMTVFDEEGVKIVFRMKKGSDEAETIIKAVISNSNEADVEEFAMQAAVPKYMKVQMKPISDPIIPGRNEDVSTQLIRVRNNAYGEVGREKGE